MKFVKCVFLIVFIAVLCQNNEAKSVKKSEAAVIAENFFKLYLNKIDSEVGVVNNYVLCSEDIPLIYIFNLTEGWIMIPSDDAAFPILAYSETGQYNPEFKNPAFDEWVDNYIQQMIELKENNLSGSDKTIELWKNLYQGNTSGFFNGEEVEPLIHTQWNQDCYYNSMCPADTAGPCDYTYSGCVATAMGQVMAYYHYPMNGSGSNSYYDYPYGTISADFTTANYNWPEMANTVTEENDAVAELIFHCAVSVNTDFGILGSGAFDPDARNALVQHFLYDISAQYIERDDYTTQEWEQLLTTELDESRPVIYGAVGRLYGHTFICDGYQPGGYYHMNWGWGGIHNGYYLLDKLNPGGLNFNLYHDMIIGITPASAPLAEIPQGIQAIASGSTVMIQWNAVTSGTDYLIGYNIFRDGVVVNNLVCPGTSYEDANLSSGWHTYHVTAVYFGVESAASADVAIEIENIGIENHVLNRVKLISDPYFKNFILQFPSSIMDLTIKIFDIRGMELYRTQVNCPGSRIEIPVGNLPPAIYLLRVETSNEARTFKMNLK